MKFQVMTIITAADVVAKLAGFTVYDGISGFGLFIGRIKMLAVIIPAKVKNLLDF